MSIPGEAASATRSTPVFEKLNRRIEQGEKLAGLRTDFQLVKQFSGLRLA
jgi:hypothetical protein